MKAAFAQELPVVLGYDELGRLAYVVNGAGVRTYTYDAVGNILAIESEATGCFVDAPGITRVVSDTCFAGASCQIRIDGTSLLGAGVTSGNLDIAVTDCRAECGEVRCAVTAAPTVAPGPVKVTLSTPLGSVEGTVEIFPPPALETSGQVGIWHFAASAETAITLGMNRIANNADGSSTLDPTLAILDSRGFELASDDDSGLNFPLGPGRNAVIRNLSLPATDTYTVIARGAGGTAGPYVLDMMPPTVVLVPGQVAAPGPDTRVLVFSGEVVGVERDTLTFAATIGERVTIDAHRVANQDDGSGSLDPAVELHDSRDFLLAGDFDTGTDSPAGPGRNALLPNFLLPATDTYRLIVFGEAGSVGRYEVRVTLRPPDGTAAGDSDQSAAKQPGRK